MALRESLPTLLAAEVSRLLQAVSLPATARIFLLSITKSLVSQRLTEEQARRIREEILIFAERVYKLESEPQLIDIQVEKKIEESATRALPAGIA